MSECLLNCLRPIPPSFQKLLDDHQPHSMSVPWLPWYACKAQNATLSTVDLPWTSWCLVHPSPNLGWDETLHLLWFHPFEWILAEKEDLWLIQIWCEQHPAPQEPWWCHLSQSPLFVWQSCSKAGRGFLWEQTIPSARRPVLLPYKPLLKHALPHDMGPIVTQPTCLPTTHEKHWSTDVHSHWHHNASMWMHMTSTWMRCHRMLFRQLQ